MARSAWKWRWPCSLRRPMARKRGLGLASIMKKAEVLALIPARGGSKSVPRKNLLEVAGKPLIAYSIGHALDCALITRTIVSTDDDEIAAVATRFGGEVPFRRPAEFATDTATDLQVFRHALPFF